MSSRVYRGAATALCMVMMLALAVVATPARNTQTNRNTSEMREASSRAARSARVLDQVMRIPARAIPQELISRAEAVMVFPGVFRAAFGIGGRGGKGLITRRLPNGQWSAPAFFTMGGGSFGPQIGATSTDFVLLIMNQDGLRGLLGDRFTLGADAAVAAGPVGRTAAAQTNLTLDAGILSYSRSRGLFAGLSLNGVVVTPDNDLNQAVYSRTANDILMEASAMPMAEAPTGVRVFAQTVARHAGSR